MAAAFKHRMYKEPIMKPIQSILMDGKNTT